MPYRELLSRLDQIRTLDTQFEVFGSHVHKYDFQLVSDAELTEFEQWYGAKLPPEYRLFLQEIGTGSGPSYGLYELNNAKAELKIICDDYAEESGKYFAPSHQLCTKTARQIQAGYSSDLVDLPDLSPSHPGGFIPIGTRGCDYVTVLLTDGDLAGLVVDSGGFAAIGSTWNPPRSPVGIDLTAQQSLGFGSTFLDWFQCWLDACLADLQKN